MSSPVPTNVAPNAIPVDNTINYAAVAGANDMTIDAINHASGNAVAVPAEATVIVHDTMQTKHSTLGNGLPVIVQNIPTVAFAEGTKYTMATPPEEFEDWVAYTLYCEDGPTIRVLCAKEVVNNRCVSLSGLNISKKLLGDHSSYFAALLSGPWKEAKDCVLRLPDVRIEDFKRLHLTLLAGGAAPRNNIGKPTAVITNLAETYLLADYFNMAKVQGWLKASLNDYLAELRGWGSLYVNQIMAHTGGNAAEQMHMAKVADFANAYNRLKKLVPEQQIMDPEELVRFVVGHCPRPLLASVITTLDKEFKDEIISVYLLL